MFRFYSLPGELQTTILNFIFEDPCPSSRLVELPLARYACVNKHWNDFFESRTFKTLTIRPKDIGSLATTITPRRRAYLKHLWFRIPLTEKHLTPEAMLARPDPVPYIGLNFTRSIVALWDVISTWNEQKGMTLELSASSACCHEWNETGRKCCIDKRRKCFIEKEAFLYKEYLSSGQLNQYDRAEDIHERHNSIHKEVLQMNFHSVWSRNFAWNLFVNRLFGTKPVQFRDEQLSPMDYQWALPPVKAISKFLIRRQNFHGICPTALNTILSSLEGIEDIHIERWRRTGYVSEKIWCAKAQNSFARELPRSTKSLSLYGETNQILNKWESKDANVISFAKTLRQYTNFLEHLSISHMVDARDFFHPFSSANEEATGSLRGWPNLKTLSLTSDVFKTGTKQEINSLLCTAARAAKKMPKLEMLQLWNGDAERACVFSCRVEDTVGEITWSGTHINTLAREVVKEWNAVSVFFSRTDTRELVIPMKKEDVASTGQVLAYLSNKDRIMHPVSAYGAIGKNAKGEKRPEWTEGYRYHCH